MNNKKVIFIGGLPGSGKTTYSFKLAQTLTNCTVYDLDHTSELIMTCFNAFGYEFNPENEIFRSKIRDIQYKTMFDIELNSLRFLDIIILVAPFTKEFRNEDTFCDLKTKFKDFTQEFIWITCDREILKQSIVNRNAVRDNYKLQNIA